MAATAQVASARHGGLPARGGRASLGGAVRSELTKIRSVRSTFWTLAAMILVTIGIGALFSFGHAQSFGQLTAAQQARVSPESIAHAADYSLFGLILGQLIVAVLGALTITSEYSTGMVRTSLTVMPRRGTLFAAKGLVFAAVALAAGLATSFASFFIGQAILSTQHISTTLGHPGVLRSVVGGGLFLACCGLLSYGIGAVLRHSAGAITASIALLFVAYILSNFLPRSWAEHVDKWIPFNAGAAIWENVSAPDMFSPWTGFAVFAAYTAVALAAGLILFRRRDA